MLAGTAKARLTQLICPACRLFSSASVALYPTQSHAFTSRSSSSAELSSSAKSIIFTSPVYNPDPDGTDQQHQPLKYYRRRNVLSDAEGEFKQDQRRGKGNQSDPYERLSGSPKRMCIVTRQILPSSFLINLRPTYFPTTSESPEILKLLPDRILTKGRSKKGKGIWVSCNRDIIDRLMGGKGPHTGILNQIQGLTIPPNLNLVIHAQLTERINIELSSLAKRLQAASSTTSSTSSEGENPKLGNQPILRRLTNLEVSRLKLDISNLNLFNHDISSFENPSDVLTNKPNLRNEEADGGKGEIIALLDISGLSSSTFTTLPGPDENSTCNPDSSNIDKIDIPLISLNQSNAKQIPLYDLSKLFPFPASHQQHLQGIEILSNLKKILSIERKFKRRNSIANPTSHTALDPKSASELNSGPIRDHSDILAIYYYPSNTHISPSTHDERNLLGIPLSIALWRLRCFLGNGWKTVRA